jgi:hypothetical protein
MKNDEKCRGSGFILGGYRDQYEGQTLKEMCTHCRRQVDAVPIAPEPHTDLRIDGTVVMVIRKQIVDHKFGSLCAMRWRRDGHSWLFLTAFIYWVFAMIYALYCSV